MITISSLKPEFLGYPWYLKPAKIVPGWREPVQRERVLYN